MSYTALYRKFRPQAFSDVKGQEHIVTTLKNQVASERLSHAYIFCGTRGTGKTTIAKIMARLVNCEHPTTEGPCGECDSCKAIASGNSMNVIEIDAASNNGVDNIREIIEQVSYSPVNAKYKVYIIDEVHMLSTGAFNALLKTLEEPPSYVIFILATTDVHKVPITILSRCQRYDFKRITIDTIADRLKELTDIEGLNIEDKALRYVAKVADGSMRDALSLLDQCVAFNFGEVLTYDKTLDILGAVDTRVFSDMLRLIMNNKILEAIDLLEEITLQGRELSQFVADFIWYLRNLMLVKSCATDDIEDVLEVSSDRLEALKQEADGLTLETIFRYINVFSDTANNMKYSSQKRIQLEMTIVKLCKPQMEVDTQSVLERIRVIEEKIENGVSLEPQDVSVVSAAPKKEAAAPIIINEELIPEEAKLVYDKWADIVASQNHYNHEILKNAKPYVDQSTGMIVLGFVNDSKGRVHYRSMLLEERRVEIESIITEAIGKQVHLSAPVIGEDRDDLASKHVDLGKNLSSINGFTVQHVSSDN